MAKSWRPVRNEMRWQDEDVIYLALDFLALHDLDDDFQDWLEAKAENEKAKEDQE
jgi:hypothetical protein